MNLISNIQKKYRKSNKLVLSLKIIISAFATYFAIRVMFISISGLISSNHSSNTPNLLLFGMLFSLGLSNIVQVIEMLVTGKKEHFTLLLATTIFIMSVSG